MPTRSLKAVIASPRKFLFVLIMLAGLAPVTSSAQTAFNALPNPFAGSWHVESQSVHVTTAVRKFSARELTYTLRYGALWRSAGQRWVVRLASNIGSLQAREEADLLFGFGPLLEYRPRLLRSRGLVELGSGVHWIDGDGFADEQLGQRLQFQSHLALGISLGLGARTALMLRVQHISNAGLSEHNPGLDLAGLELRHRFGGA